jgi:four helix bundle protein
MSDFKKLHAWRLALDVTKSVYRITRSFPENEKFGLVPQMRRAAVSIMSNIAEGSRRRDKDQQHFLRIAQGSAAELESQLILAREIGLLNPHDSVVFNESTYMASVLYLYRRSLKCP